MSGGGDADGTLICDSDFVALVCVFGSSDTCEVVFSCKQRELVRVVSFTLWRESRKCM